MTELAAIDVVVRPATASDVELLYRWRSDPATRAASFNGADIPFAAHQAWLLDVLADPERQLYVAEVGGVAVGTIRSDRREDVVELSWTVAPECRGRGYGTRMVGIVAGSIPGAIEARVKPENIASVRIAEAAGMRLETRGGGILRFVRGPLEAQT